MGHPILKYAKRADYGAIYPTQQESQCAEDNAINAEILEMLLEETVFSQASPDKYGGRP